mgnify:CR=1 FL=1|tara:strand:- start:5545 stop:6585 length:1041 start_codon:yes stop_codon:yes gene_type:complete
MATIRKRGKKYLAAVRKSGVPPISKSFDTRQEAKKWATKIEVEIDSGRPQQKRKKLGKVTFGDLIERYIEEVDPFNKFCESKLVTLRLTQREFGSTLLSSLTIKKVIEYAKQRRLGSDAKKGVAPSTLNTQLQYMGELIEFARVSWDIDLGSNPARDARYALSKMKLVGPSRKRDRRLRPGEYERLLEAAKGHWVSHFIVIIVYNAMRLGEIHGLVWEDIDFNRRELIIRNRKDPNHKEGNDQTIPMADETWSLLHGLWHTSKKRGRVFCQVAEAGSVSDKFADVVSIAAIEDLHFHDLRHEACSRLFEKGLSIQQVSLISGHRSWDTLKRYTHLRAKDVLPALQN